MSFRSLGRTGVQVSPLCLGAMNFGNPTPEDESIRIIDAALDGGINFIDTANVYNAGESERIVGKALRQNGKRDEVVLATKVNGEMGPGPNDRGISRRHILKACEDSLRRLQTEYIDLYQLHRPSLTIPQDETLGALDDLIDPGIARERLHRRGLEVVFNTSNRGVAVAGPAEVPKHGGVGLLRYERMAVDAVDRHPIRVLLDDDHHPARRQPQTRGILCNRISRLTSDAEPLARWRELDVQGLGVRKGQPQDRCMHAGGVS